MAQKKSNIKRIIGIILLTISIIVLLTTLGYTLLFFYVFDVSITNSAGYSLLFGWLADKIILVLVGIVGIVYSTYLIRRKK